MQVIENGFDNELWKPSEQARAGLRQELELPDDALVIGLAARFDMQKDHENFFRAAHILSKKHPDTHFLLCGQGIDHQNRRLIEIMQQCEMTGNVHLLGDRDDMHRVTAAFDIATMSSAYGEGFPNVIGEAMACEVCCVATDVGDAGRIIGNTGWLVPKRDPEALAASWAAAIEAGVTERRRMGRSARDRVKVKFSLGRSIRAYQDLYHGLTH
jgi:glycosyltransferase involved in cell wall biosynthesis